MIRDNQRILNRIHVLLDALVVAGSYILSWYIKFQIIDKRSSEITGALSQETYFKALYYIVPLYVSLLYVRPVRIKALLKQRSRGI